MSMRSDMNMKFNKVISDKRKLILQWQYPFRFNSSIKNQSPFHKISPVPAQQQFYSSFFPRPPWLLHCFPRTPSDLCSWSRALWFRRSFHCPHKSRGKWCRLSSHRSRWNTQLWGRRILQPIQQGPKHVWLWFKTGMLIKRILNHLI